MSPDPGTPGAGPGANRDRERLPPLTRDSHGEDVTPHEEPRDSQARAVRRVTVGVAAAALLGTAVFAGLAAADSQDSASGEDAPTATGRQTGGDGPSGGGAVEDMPHEFFRDDAQAPSGSDWGAPVAPSGSNQAPVAPSGAS